MNQPAPPKSYILSELKEVGLPQDISWMPQTIGWKVLALAILLLVLFGLYRLMQRWWQNRYRHEAISVVESIELSASNYEYQLFVVAKRVLAYLNPAHNSLFGQPFIDTLSAYEPNTASAFESQLAKQWLESLHSTKANLSNTQREQLKQSLLHWLKHHKEEASQ